MVLVVDRNVSGVTMASALFLSKVRTFGPRYMRDLGLKAHHVAGLFGNFGVESAEFTARQEKKPTVKGSKGGLGWVQWTGMGTAAKPGRRRQFETHAAAYDLREEAKYDEACYTFSVWELRNTEKAALAALKRTTTVDAATICVMEKYERPGVPHKDRRLALGRAALQVLGGLGKTTPAPIKLAEPALGGVPDVTYGKPWIRGVEYPVLRSMQEALRAKGYYKTGDVDGKYGRFTRNSMTAFRQDNSMSVSSHYDAAAVDETLQAVMSSTPVALSPERTMATVETLAPKSEVVQASLAASLWSKLTGWGGALSTLVFGTVAAVPNAHEKVAPLQEIAPSLPAWVLPAAVVAVAAGVSFAAYKATHKANKVPAIKLAEYQSGGAA